MEDELLVCGYLRCMISALPTDLVNEIIRWYSEEMIHWIEFGGPLVERQHYAIPLSLILNSLM